MVNSPKVKSDNLNVGRYAPKAKEEDLLIAWQ